jgi:3'-phosphoadenosine 5'-phosphosulfate sulfotransferase (PAPS reductase)/FAD synthetase
MWVWKQGYRPLSAEEAAEVVHTALQWLVPTGNPYLDLCIWKGRFPSRRAQFCTEELKVTPINDQVTGPLLRAGHTVISWQGVRAAESVIRASYAPFQRLNLPSALSDAPGRLYAYRPLLTWTTEEVFAYADRFGVPRNPLYGFGCGRVGCFPCINASKAELALVDRVFPEQIIRLEGWEDRVSHCSKRGMTTFFNIVNDPVMAEAWGWSERAGERLELSHRTHGVRQMIEWAKTDRGGRQFNLFPIENEVCSTAGVCE